MAASLIRYGADVNQQSDDWKLPLLVARERGNLEMIALLRAHGATDDAWRVAWSPRWPRLAGVGLEVEGT